MLFWITAYLALALFVSLVYAAGEYFWEWTLRDNVVYGVGMFVLGVFLWPAAIAGVIYRAYKAKRNL